MQSVPVDRAVVDVGKLVEDVLPYHCLMFRYILSSLVGDDVENNFGTGREFEIAGLDILLLADGDLLAVTQTLKARSRQYLILPRFHYLSNILRVESCLEGKLVCCADYGLCVGSYYVYFGRREKNLSRRR